MSLKPERINPVPEETARIAHAAYPRGNVFMQMRDELGTIYEDEYYKSVVLLSLARLWQASGDGELLILLTPLLGSTPAETEKILRSVLNNTPDEPSS